MNAGFRIEWREGEPGSDFDGVVPPGSPAEPPAAGMKAALAWRGETPVARLSVMLREGLVGAPGPSGLIGHYAALDDAAGVTLLRAAIDELRLTGVARILGPMNGSTWARYRLALPDDRALTPFLGEPQNPPQYVEQFAAAGLGLVAHYASTIGPLDGSDPPRGAERAARVAERGIVVAPLRMDAFEDELRGLHAFSIRAFADNLYFTPITEQEFVAMYTPLRRLLDPGLVLLARDASGGLAGYVLAYPDPLGPGRLVIKTLAVAPEWRSVGLGGHLTALVRRAARERGLREAIHALMHVENASTRIATEGMRLFRQYALFGMTLG